MQAEDLVLDKSGKREEVEEVGEVFPDICITVLSEAFVVETIDLGDLAGLVIATENGDALGVANFESNEKGDGFDGEVSTINVIA